MTEQVVIVTLNGVARLESERVRIDAIKAAGKVPRLCGDAIPVAPARGPMIRFTPREARLSECGGVVVWKSGEAGRDGARVADTFDKMEREAIRYHRRRGDDAGPYVPLFTSGQIAAGRDYATLVERVSASGVKCSSIEAQSGSGGQSGGGREEAMLADFQRLRALQHRIGNGLAKEVRRIRPSGRKRSAIYARRLVDLVCLSDTSIEDVLDRHGWAVDHKSRKALRRSLCAALDRMQGYSDRLAKEGG
jgi:hypothetical protein